MNILLAILLIILAFGGGVILGIYINKKSTDRQLANHPRLTVDSVRTMLSSNGQRPSEAKVQQVYRQIIKQQKAELEKRNKKKK